MLKKLLKYLQIVGIVKLKLVKKIVVCLNSMLFFFSMFSVINCGTFSVCNPEKIFLILKNEKKNYFDIFPAFEF